MSTYLTATQSVCRECRRLLPARLEIRDQAVWMVRVCPDHGCQESLVYGDAEAYLKLSHYHRKASMHLAFSTEYRGCPGSCGFCPEHEQHVCMPILEITDHCNLDCPICLVANPGQRHMTREEVSRILDELIRTEGQVDVLNLSGGEPTLNPHFREIIEECLSRKEILRVSLSTNGLVLARDDELLRFLAERRVIISLQFDGLNDSIYTALRGRAMLADKLRLIERCGSLDAAMSLTVTAVRGVNDICLPDLLNLLFDHDHVLSMMFQPAAYAGQAARLGRPANAMTIPDVIRSLKGGGRGMVNPEDFSPLPCSHPACFSLAFYLKTEDRRFMPIKQMVEVERYLDLIQNRAIMGTDSDSFSCICDAVYDLWSGPAATSPDSGKALKAIRCLLESATSGSGYTPRQALSVAERSVKSIFIHQFMDPDTFDLSRVRKCCQVYPQADGRMLPVCMRNCVKGCA